MSIKRALNKESSYENFLHLDEKRSRGISYSSQIVFFQSLHYTCFSSAICPLQVPGTSLSYSSEFRSEEYSTPRMDVMGHYGTEGEILTNR